LAIIKLKFFFEFSINLSWKFWLKGKNFIWNESWVRLKVHKYISLTKKSFIQKFYDPSNVSRVSKVMRFFCMKYVCFIFHECT
jgi:hypothetical protein